MKLASLPFFKKNNPFAYFLVLVLRNEKVNAVIFEELEGKIRVIGQRTEYFESSIEEVSIDEMLDVLDKAISSAELSLPKNIETQKTIFGLKETWVENDKIKKEYLLKLKKVSDELGLTPIGFLIITQAISHLLYKEEGAPLSTILTELGNKSITVSIIRVGRIIETKSSEIHQSVPYTVDTLLKHFQTSEILPSRIILFDGEKDLSQEFISHTWSKSLPFLHLPQIASLPPNFDAKAVLFGAAAQMGFEVLQEPKKKEISEEEYLPEELETQKEEKGAKMLQQENYLRLEEFGFISEKDIAKTPVAKPLQPTPTLTNLKVNPIVQIIKNNFTKLSDVLRKLNLKSLMPKIPIPQFIKNNFVLPVFVIVALIASIIFYLFGTSANVVLNIKPRLIEQNKKVTFLISQASDLSKVIINAETVTVSEDGSNSIVATSKKEVGNRSKGKVTIFNSLSQQKTLSQGTKIEAPNGLGFTLDDSLTIKGVASHSADETVAPSTIQAAVTASQIGKESNLPSGTKFSVSSFETSDIVAKNDNPFSGGTKKEVTVASKNDIDKLIEELPKTLERKAKEDIDKQVPKDKNRLPIFTNITLSKKNLNKEAGQETDKVTLNATVAYESVAYKKDDINSLIRFLIKDSISSNMTINYDKLKTDFKAIEQKNKTITANLNIKALLQPKIDKKTLASSIAGKSYEDAKIKLLKIPQVSNVNIALIPNIPFLPKVLSRTSKNIKIIVNVDE